MSGRLHCNNFNFPLTCLTLSTLLRVASQTIYTNLLDASRKDAGQFGAHSWNRSDQSKNSLNVVQDSSEHRRAVRGKRFSKSVLQRCPAVGRVRRQLPGLVGQLNRARLIVASEGKRRITASRRCPTIALLSGEAIDACQVSAPRE